MMPQPQRTAVEQPLAPRSRSPSPLPHHAPHMQPPADVHDADSLQALAETRPTRQHEHPAPPPVSARQTANSGHTHMPPDVAAQALVDVTAWQDVVAPASAHRNAFDWFGLNAAHMLQGFADMMPVMSHIIADAVVQREVRFAQLALLRMRARSGQLNGNDPSAALHTMFGDMARDGIVAADEGAQEEVLYALTQNQAAVAAAHHVRDNTRLMLLAATQMRESLSFTDFDAFLSLQTQVLTSALDALCNRTYAIAGFDAASTLMDFAQSAHVHDDDESSEMSVEMETLMRFAQSAQVYDDDSGSELGVDITTLLRSYAVAPFQEVQNVASALEDVAAWHNGLKGAHVIELSLAQTRDIVCPISMLPFSDIAYPVAVRAGTVPHVFDAESLLMWMKESFNQSEDAMTAINPLTREPLHVADILRVTSL